jgi:dihydroorotate dehydrogenase
MLIGNAPVSRCSNLEELIALDCSSSVDIIYTKTISNILRADTNKSPPFYYYDSKKDMSVNKIGLISKSWTKYYKEALLTRKWNKHLVISVHPNMAREVLDDVNAADNPQILVEVNISCVNIAQNTLFKTAQNTLNNILNNILQIIGKDNKCKVGIKLWPILEEHNLRDIAKILHKAHDNKQIQFITAVNTFCGIMEHNDELYEGGIAGIPLRAIALKNILFYRQQMPNIIIHGVGGINCKDDVKIFEKAGANVCLIGTHYQNKGIKIFSKL